MPSYPWHPSSLAAVAWRLKYCFSAQNIAQSTQNQNCGIKILFWSKIRCVGVPNVSQKQSGCSRPENFKNVCLKPLWRAPGDSKRPPADVSCGISSAVGSRGEFLVPLLSQSAAFSGIPFYLLTNKWENFIYIFFISIWQVTRLCGCLSHRIMSYSH